MKFQSNVNNLVNLFIFWKKLEKCLVTYETKCMANTFFENNLNQTKIVNFKKYSPIVLFNYSKRCAISLFPKKVHATLSTGILRW